MDTVKAWALVAVCLLAIVAAGFFSLPPLLDHYDKARAQTRIEVKNMEADADLIRAKRLQAGIVTLR